MSDTNSKPEQTVVKTLAQDPGKYRDKFEKGIGFFANGNEPFWSLEIDFNNYMHFKSLTGIDITTPAVKGVKAMDADVTRYAAETEKGSLIVQLMKQDCINDMSGEKFPFRVTVDVKAGNESNYASYKGCGQNLADYRLYDIWVLDSIDHKKIVSADYPLGLPRLEFNLTENRVAGFTGCNNMNGSILVMGNKIQFNRITNTLKACPGVNDNDYLQHMSNQTVIYTIDKLKLFLKAEDGIILVYKKVD